MGLFRNFRYTYTINKNIQNQTSNTYDGLGNSVIWNWRDNTAERHQWESSINFWSSVLFAHFLKFMQLININNSKSKTKKQEIIEIKITPRLLVLSLSIINDRNLFLLIAISENVTINICCNKNIYICSCRNSYLLGIAFHVLKMFTFCCLTVSLWIQWILTFFTPNFLLNPSFFHWILSSSQQDSILLSCPFSVCDSPSSFISVVYMNIGGRPFNWELTMSDWLYHWSKWFP